MTISDTKSLPFATYDIVVYLTTGFLALVATSFIILPHLGLDSAIVEVSKQPSFIYSIIAFISFLLASYVYGHLIAFISSYVIERLVHSFLGYPSDVYFTLATNGKVDDRTVFISSVKSYRFSLVSFGLILLSLPAIPVYVGIYLIGAFGFYYPKIPFALLPKLKERIKSLNLGVECAIGTRWIKVVEHYVANHCPVAYVRLYNYLVIFGLFRSVSLMSLCLLWAFWILIIFHNITFEFAGKSWTLALNLGWAGAIFAFAVLSAVHVLNVMAFCKFNRRYFEEAVLAFLLCDPKASPTRSGHD